jgi:hypothetical protein
LRRSLFVFEAITTGPLVQTRTRSRRLK